MLKCLWPNENTKRKYIRFNANKEFEMSMNNGQKRNENTIFVMNMHDIKNDEYE